MLFYVTIIIGDDMSISDMLSDEDKAKNTKMLMMFFKEDKYIKEQMVKLVPPKDTFDEYVIEKYSNDLYDTLKHIFNDLIMFSNFFSPYLTKSIENIKDRTLNNLAEAKLDINKLKKFYVENISDMSEELVRATKKDFKGYYYSGTGESLKFMKTLNEVLHVLHSSIVNNNDLYNSLNVVGTKKISEYNDLKYFGIDNEISRTLYESFPDELCNCTTDIVGLENNCAMMMVRDLGHALTIEFQSIGEEIRVSYFIPKLCNKQMINELPGVKKVDDSVDMFEGTTGTFYTTKENLVSDVYSFMKKVPTDSDIVYDKNY